jgi:hypothetical protein
MVLHAIPHKNRCPRPASTAVCSSGVKERAGFVLFYLSESQKHNSIVLLLEVYYEFQACLLQSFPGKYLPVQDRLSAHQLGPVECDRQVYYIHPRTSILLNIH